MHYVGQAAATFEYVEGHASTVTALTADQNSATVGALVASSILLFAILLLAIADLRVWYYNQSAIIRELDVRATLASADLRTENEIFLAEYKALRESDGSQKAIMELRFKFKKSNSGPTDSWADNTSQGRSSVIPTDEVAETASTGVGHLAKIEEV